MKCNIFFQCSAWIGRESGLRFQILSRSSWFFICLFSIILWCKNVVGEILCKLKVYCILSILTDNALYIFSFPVYDIFFNIYSVRQISRGWKCKLVCSSKELYFVLFLKEKGNLITSIYGVENFICFGNIRRNGHKFNKFPTSSRI